MKIRIVHYQPPVAAPLALSAFAELHHLTLVVEQHASEVPARSGRAKRSWLRKAAQGPQCWTAAFDGVSAARDLAMAAPSGEGGAAVAPYGRGTTPWEAIAHYAELIGGQTLLISRRKSRLPDFELVAPALSYQASRWTQLSARVGQILAPVLPVWTLNA